MYITFHCMKDLKYGFVKIQQQFSASGLFLLVTFGLKKSHF